MTADAARAHRHSGAKCVPREPTAAMLNAAYRPLGEPGNESPVRNAWMAAHDAAPACECEAERLLREWFDAWDAGSDLDVINADAAARAYLARSKP